MATTERSYREVRKNMRLNQKQQRLFREQGLKHKKSLASVHYELEDLRKQILDELSKPEPDTNILFNLTEKSGIVHMGLMKNNIKHLIELKKSWNPEQYEMLDKVFRETLSPEGRNSSARQGQYRNRKSKDLMERSKRERRN